MIDNHSLDIKYKGGTQWWLNRLLNSNVLIIELTGSNTELAKNLILAGVNITICDDKLITEVDADTNFLFGSSDIGK